MRHQGGQDRSARSRSALDLPTGHGTNRWGPRDDLYGASTIPAGEQLIAVTLGDVVGPQTLAYAEESREISMQRGGGYGCASAGLEAAGA